MILEVYEASMNPFFERNSPSKNVVYGLIFSILFGNYFHADLSNYRLTYYATPSIGKYLATAFCC